jgi:hypothetical protein
MGVTKGQAVRAHRWRSTRWQHVAEVAETIRAASFEDASAVVRARLDRRLIALAALVRNVDGRGSAVDGMLREGILLELAGLAKAQRSGRGAVLLVQWPLSPLGRLRLAQGLTDVEWAELAASSPRRMTAIRIDLFVCRRLLGPSSATFRVADRLAGGVRREPSPTGVILLP